MNTEEIAIKLFTAWERHDLSTTASLLADDFELTGWTSQPLDRVAFVLFQRIHNQAFPNWHFELSDRQRFGRELYLTYRIRAIHTGVFDPTKLGLLGPPIEPSGKSRIWPVTYAVITVWYNKISRFEVDCAPGGDLNGTLAWLREPGRMTIH